MLFTQFLVLQAVCEKPMTTRKGKLQFTVLHVASRDIKHGFFFCSFFLSHDERGVCRTHESRRARNVIEAVVGVLDLAQMMNEHKADAMLVGNSFECRHVCIVGFITHFASACPTDTLQGIDDDELGFRMLM